MRRLLGVAGFVAGWVLLDWVSYIHEFLPIGITPWNPPPGLGLAALLLLGPRVGPLLFVGALLADFLVRPHFAPLPLTVLSAAVIAATYTLAAVGLARLGRIDPNLARLRDAFRLTVAAGGASLVVALSYVGMFFLAGMLPLADVPAAVARYWVGDAIGIMVVAPVLLVHRRPRWPKARHLAEGAVQILALLAALYLIFGLSDADEFRLFYLLFLPQVWIAVRFGIQGAALGNVVVQLGLIVSFHLVGHESPTVTSFQFLMLALALTSLLLGASVSERRRAEESLRLRQDELARFSRLSMAGEMAAALAHELNQPLSATITYTRAAQRFLAAAAPDLEKVRGAMDKAVAQADRAGAIIRTLREFIGKGATDRRLQPLSQLLADALGLAGPDCAKAGITLVVGVDKGLPDVHVDAVQVQQVLLNLIRNAMEAMDRTRPGQPRIEVSARPAVEGQVEVEVRDNGSGIAVDVAERLFEPFNTSKATGMGLGLVISRTIVESHGGRLWLAESGSGGSCFRFTLPAREGVTG